MIEKGEEWGRGGLLPADGALVEDDRSLARALSQSVTPLLASVRRGDLARTLGLAPDRDLRGGRYVVEIDAIEVALDDGEPLTAVAHVVAGDFRMSRRCVAIMNAAFVGRLNVAPRAHPGDGMLDVVTFDLSPSDRLKAHRRMPLAAHMPHPKIEARRRTDGLIDLSRSRSIRLDGQRVGRARSLRYRVLPATFELSV